MDLWAEAIDEVNDLDQKASAWDKRIQVAQVKALLSIAQELSRIHHNGIQPDYSPDRG